jgi:hypothetical protein
MLIGVLISCESLQRIAADPWLSQLDWLVLTDAAQLNSCQVDLLLLEDGCFSPDVDLDLLLTPCWCFAAGSRCWDYAPAVDTFAGELEPQALGQRLLAWLWLANQVIPSCFTRQQLVLTNGRLSLRTFDPAPGLLQMSVCPAGSVGGDVVLYLEREGRTLVVLADAIGHGDDAALDAAVFALAVIDSLGCGPLNQASVQNLNQALMRQLGCGRFVAASFLDFDLVRREVHLLNAGMPDVLSLSRGGQVERYPATHPPLGLPMIPGFGLQRLPLSSFSQWVSCSDGVDTAALLRALRLAQIDTALYDNCINGSAMAVALPIRKVSCADDDAAQVIVGIA